jgi:thioredoxin-related protein
MKRSLTHYLLYAVVALCGSSFYLQASTLSTTTIGGIQFYNGNFDEVVSLAQQQNKYLFVHTTSGKCVPCFEMSNDLYGDEKAAQYHNNNFINYIMHVDEPEYNDFARMNDLGKEFTVFYYNPGGMMEEIATQNEIQNVETLISKGRQVLQLRTEENWKMLEMLMAKQAEKQELSSDELRTLSYLARTFGKPYNSLVDAYLTSFPIEQRASKENREFIYYFADNLNNNAINNLLTDRDYFNKVYGSAKVNTKIKIAINNTLEWAIKNKRSDIFDKMLAIIDNYPMRDSDLFAYTVRSHYYHGMRDWNNLAKVSIEYIEQYQPTDPILLNQAAERFFDFMGTNASAKDQKRFELGLRWAERSVKIAPECYNNLTIARYYQTLGRCEDAVNAANKCGEIVKYREQNPEKTRDAKTVNMEQKCAIEAINLIDGLRCE